MLTHAQTAALVALLFACFLIGQMVDGPTEAQHAQDLDAEVASLEAEHVALQRVQHPSAVEPARRRHASVVVAQGGAR